MKQSLPFTVGYFLTIMITLNEFMQLRNPGFGASDNLPPSSTYISITNAFKSQIFDILRVASNLNLLNQEIPPSSDVLSMLPI